MFVVFFIFQSSPAAPSSLTSSSSMTFVVASSHDSSSSSWDLRGKLQRGGILVASSHLGLRLHRLISTRLSRRLPGRLLHGTSEEACRGQVRCFVSMTIVQRRRHRLLSKILLL
uniref:Uncharacterized protein n=1 Tax=Brassica oleracea TaxID=3712 RepID=A0A3P6C5B1_BRAOL|nr:unnamed protein product [Brassica oleracea]